MNDHSNSKVIKPEISQTVFGQIHANPVYRISVVFEEKLRFSLLNYGAIISEISIPDKNGKVDNVVHSYDELQAYIDDEYYIGAIIGRYSNRIKDGRFSLNNEEFQLSRNSGKHHLHGGFNGFNKLLWKIDSIKELEDSVEIKMSILSENEEEGYPGNLKVYATFTVNQSSINIDIEGISDKDSIFNPTHHSYFNLSGMHNRNINSHTLMLNADKIVEVNSEGIPSGAFLNVEGTDFDFKKPKLIEGEYDHCWVLNQNKYPAILKDKLSGRILKISTNRPGMQVYTANDFRNDPLFPFRKHHSVCLEPQYFPNSPNQSNFPDASIESNVLHKFSCTYNFGLI